MCRNIKPLFNFEPRATEEEIQNASIQFVKKLSGMQKISLENKIIFDKSVEEISVSIKKLLENLKTNAPKKNREIEASKAKLRNEKRFGEKENNNFNI